MNRFFATLLAGALLIPMFAVVSPGDPGGSTPQTPQQQVCNGIGLTTSDGSCGDKGAQFSAVITAIINLLLVIIGVVSVIVIIISGFNFITSGGDSGKVATARNSILYAVIGLVVVAFSEIIVHFVIGVSTPK